MVPVWYLCGTCVWGMFTLSISLPLAGYCPTTTTHAHTIPNHCALPCPPPHPPPPFHQSLWSRAPDNAAIMEVVDQTLRARHLITGWRALSTVFKRASVTVSQHFGKSFTAAAAALRTASTLGGPRPDSRGMTKSFLTPSRSKVHASPFSPGSSSAFGALHPTNSGEAASPASPLGSPSRAFRPASALPSASKKSARFSLSDSVFGEDYEEPCPCSPPEAVAGGPVKTPPTLRKGSTPSLSDEVAAEPGPGSLSWQPQVVPSSRSAVLSRSPLQPGLAEPEEGSEGRQRRLRSVSVGGRSQGEPASLPPPQPEKREKQHRLAWLESMARMWPSLTSMRRRRSSSNSLRLDLPVDGGGKRTSGGRRSSAEGQQRGEAAAGASPPASPKKNISPKSMSTLAVPEGELAAPAAVPIVQSRDSRSSFTGRIDSMSLPGTRSLHASGQGLPVRDTPGSGLIQVRSRREKEEPAADGEGSGGRQQRESPSRAGPLDGEGSGGRQRRSPSRTAGFAHALSSKFASTLEGYRNPLFKPRERGGADEVGLHSSAPAGTSPVLRAAAPIVGVWTDCTFPPPPPPGLTPHPPPPEHPLSVPLPDHLALSRHSRLSVASVADVELEEDEGDDDSPLTERLRRGRGSGHGYTRTSIPGSIAHGSDSSDGVPYSPNTTFTRISRRYAGYPPHPHTPHTTHTLMHARTWSRTHTHTHTLMHARTCSRTHTHARTHTHMHARTHTHTHTHPYLPPHTHPQIVHCLLFSLHLHSPTQCPHPTPLPPLARHCALTPPPPPSRPLAQVLQPGAPLPPHPLPPTLRARRPAPRQRRMATQYRRLDPFRRSTYPAGRRPRRPHRPHAQQWRRGLHLPRSQRPVGLRGVMEPTCPHVALRPARHPTRQRQRLRAAPRHPPGRFRPPANRSTPVVHLLPAPAAHHLHPRVQHEP